MVHHQALMLVLINANIDGRKIPKIPCIASTMLEKLEMNMFAQILTTPALMNIATKV